MNRHDEIFCKARDIASHVHIDPEARDAMATQLVELIGLMFGAVGKSVAIEGESSMIDADSKADSRKAHNRYMIGERMQDAARELVPEVVDADIERYSRPTGAEWCVCGHHPDNHKPGGCIGVTHNKHECAGGPCTEFRVKLPEPVWVHEDRRPGLLRQLDGRGTLHIPPGNMSAPIVCYCHHSGCPNGQLDEFVAAAASVKQPAELDCDCRPICTDDGYQHELSCALTVAEHKAGHERLMRERAEMLAEAKQVEPCCYLDPDEAPQHIHHFHTGRCCYTNDEVCPDHG